MNSQTAEDVPVEPEKTWTDAILATLRPSDHGVSDEFICALLGAAADGEPLAPLLEAAGVSVPMYCVWKEKYRQMSLEQVRAARRRERWRARAVVAGLLIVAIVGGSGIVFGLARAARSQPAGSDGAVRASHEAGSSTSSGPGSDRAPTPADQASRTDPPLSEPPPPNHERGSDASRAAPAASRQPPSEGEPGASTRSVTSNPGYKIQVVAANSDREGRAIVERLAQAGYRAHLLGATVNDMEVFRVRVGPFDTLESAQAVASRLRQDGYSGAWIVR